MARSPKTAESKSTTPVFNPYAHIDDVLDGIEKDYAMSNTILDKDETRTSTGLLSLDIVLGGGIVGGSMYTVLGLEQSAKSTLASTIMANMMNTTIPVVSYMDAEGSTSSDYVESIMQNFSNDDSLTIEDLFGCKDTRTGRWIKPARVRYYAESILERVFDYIAKLQRSLPDKVKVGDDWFIIYENTKINQKIVGSNYDKEYYRTTGKFRVPIGNSDIQALVLIDSYPSLLPAKMDVEELGGAMAMQARAYSEQIKRIKGRMRSKRMTVIGINQLRLKPGVTYGSPEYEPSGEALKFACWNKDTLVYTSAGVMYPTSLDKTHLPQAVLGLKGVETPALFSEMGFSQIVKVTTNKGYSLSGKPDHRVLTLKGGGFTPKWVSLKDLSTMSNAVNYVAVKVGSNVWSENDVVFDFTYIHSTSNNIPDRGIVLPTQMSEPLAELLGYLVGDGCTVNSTMAFTTGELDIMHRVCDLLEEVFGFDSTKLKSLAYQVKPSVYNLNFTSVEVHAFLTYIGCGGKYGRNKTVPWSVMQSTSYCVSKFISALLTCDGSVSTKQITFSSVSKQLTDEIQILLLNFGVVTTASSTLLRGYKNKGGASDAALCYTLCITGQMRYIYAKYIKFMSKKQRAYTNSWSDEDDVKASYNILPKLIGWDTPRVGGRAFKDMVNQLKGKNKHHYLTDFTAEFFDTASDRGDALRTSHERDAFYTDLNGLKKFISITAKQSLLWLPVEKWSIAQEQGMTYDFNMPESHTVITNGIVSHNSDVRIKLTSRAISGVPQARGKGQVEEEPSVIIDGATDQYRYVHAKAIKNKLSTPNLEAWLRIWVTDGQRARGFDLVWDTYQYGLMTGQLYGKRDKISLKLISNQGQMLESKKPLNWMDFKTWVLGTPEQAAEVCAKIGVRTFYLRKFFAKQSATDLGLKLYFDNKLATKDSTKNTDTDDDDTRYDDDVDGSADNDSEDYDDGLNGGNKPKTRNI